MSTSTGHPGIQYAAALPRRRKWPTRVGWSTLLLVLIASAPWWLPRVKHQTSVLIWQHRCMNHLDPPTRVVYLAQARRPIQWLEFGPWKNLNNDLWPLGGKWANIFVHSRQSPHGPQRLLAVSLAIRNPPDNELLNELLVDGVVVEPGAGLQPPRTHLETVFALPDPGAGQGGRVQIFAGQPDPADRSHFTFIIRGDSRQATVDGWLKDDDTLKIEPRDFEPIH